MSLSEGARALPVLVTDPSRYTGASGLGAHGGPRPDLDG
jgi:hypothetical protein